MSNKTKLQLETELKEAQARIVILERALRDSGADGSAETSSAPARSVDTVDVQKELAQSESRFAAIFENSPVAIGISNLSDGKITDVNAGFVHLYGYTREEAIGHTTAELDLWARPEERQRFIEQLRLGNSIRNFESIARLKSGSERHVLVSGEKVEINGNPCMVAYVLDITERKQAELKRDQLTERLDLATRSARLGIWDWDIEKNTIVWDEQMYALYGLPPGRFGGAYEAWLNGVHPDDREPSDAVSAAAVRGEQEYDTEFRVLWPDGSVHWLKANGQVFRDANGTPLRMVGVNYDITERKRSEKALQQSELKYATLFEKSAVPAALTRMPQGVFVDVNEAFQSTYGYTREDVIGKTSIEIGMARPDERAQTFAAMENQRFLRDNEKHLFTKTGELRIGSIHVSRLKIDEQDFVITTIHDVTDRKRAEDGLRQSRENFAKAFSSNPAALAITRKVDGTFININEAYSSIMGYSPSEIIGHNVVEFSIYVDPQERDELLQTLAEQGRVINYELTVRGKTRELREILTSMEPIMYDHEECILSTFIDITERKLMEDELRRSNEELEQFAYVASHDLQEPLRAVAGMVQLLQKRYQGQLDERADEYIAHAVEAAGRMQALIQALLAYSRVERRNQPIEVVDAAGPLKAALTNLDVSIRENHAIITADPLPTVHADPVQLTQLFQNLIGNAIKFRSEREPQIHISATKLKESWQFSLRDNGIGIEPEYFERIFLIFQRLHTRREYSGTGIGLALCRKIVERHGGRIWVESEPGNGSTFHFTLPIRN